MNKTNNLIIAYGQEFTTFNKGEEHMVLNDEDLSFILQSLMRNKWFKITPATNL